MAASGGPEPVDPGGGCNNTISKSYKNAVGPVEYDILSIYLKEDYPGSKPSFYINEKQKSRLVFKLLGIPRENVVAIDNGEYRCIKVKLKNVSADRFRTASSLWVKEGVVTYPMKTVKRPVRATVKWAGIEDDINDQVVQMLSNFATIESGPVMDVFKAGAEDDEDVQMLNGIENGDRIVEIIPNRNIPSYCLLENGRRVKVEYPGQSFTCARCHQVAKGCKGRGNASKCEQAGGHKVKLQDIWTYILDKVPRTGRIEEKDVIKADWLLVDPLPMATSIEELQEHFAEHSGVEISKENIKISDDGKHAEIRDLEVSYYDLLLKRAGGTCLKGKTVFLTPRVDRSPKKALYNSSLEVIDMYSSSDEEESSPVQISEENAGSGDAVSGDVSTKGLQVDAANVTEKVSPVRRNTKELFSLPTEVELETTVESSTSEIATVEQVEEDDDNVILIEKVEEIANLPLSQKKRKRLLNRAKDLEKDDDGKLKTPLQVRTKRKANQVLSPDDSRNLRSKSSSVNQNRTSDRKQTKK